MAKRVLILGGTSEAKSFAAMLVARGGWDVTLSLAGRTQTPAPQPAAVRIGGFGGVAGLVEHLRQNRIDLLIDATHPYAARISHNAASAAPQAGVSIVALRRPAWEPVEGDRWTIVEDGEAAAVALGDARRRVFLALGRQEIADFGAAPQHAYVIRSVDPVEPRLDVPDAAYLLGRGPFMAADELALLRFHRIDVIVAKNSGGEATYGKIAAARVLGLPILLFQRPKLPDVSSASSVEGLLTMLDHWPPAEKRGV